MSVEVTTFTSSQAEFTTAAIVLENEGNGDYEIFFYNGSTTTQLTTNNYQDLAPQISGSNVVWYGNEGNGDYEIFFYNGSTGKITQLTNNSFNDVLPQIDGNTVAWYGNAGVNGTAEIFQTTIF